MRILVGLGSAVCIAVISLLTWGAIRQMLLIVNRFFSHQAAQSAAPHSRKPTSGRSSTAIIAQYGKLPLAFEPNVGQVNSESKFLARGAGYELFLTPRESVFVLQTPAASASLTTANKVAHIGAGTSAAVLRMKLVGANASPRFTTTGELPGQNELSIWKNPQAGTQMFQPTAA